MNTNAHNEVNSLESLTRPGAGPGAGSGNGEGRTLFLLWHGAAARWLALDQPTPHADGDDCSQPEADDAGYEESHDIARMIDEGCPHAD